MNDLTFTATVPAFLPSHSSFENLLRLVQEGRLDQAASALHCTLTKMDEGEDPWTRVGSAEITITLRSRDEVTALKITALQKELERERLASHMRQQAILERISKLQALTFDEASVTEVINVG